MTIPIDEQELASKQQTLIAIARRAFDTGLQTNAGGNLSIRLASIEGCVIKPSGIGYAECTPDNLMVVDLDGETLLGHHKPSKDKDFHVAIYRARPDVQAIVHVHSPWATGWGAARREIPLLTVQAIEKLGALPSIPLGPDGSAQSASQIGAVFQDRSIRAALLENHGTVGVGSTMLKALHLCEIIEETAHIATVRELVARAAE